MLRCHSSRGLLNISFHQVYSGDMLVALEISFGA